MSEELQFTDHEQIKTISNPDDILNVKLKSLTLVTEADKFLVLLGTDDAGFTILKKEKGNYNDIVETKGAYGSSTTTASVKQQSDIDVGGVNSMDVRQLLQDRDGGKTFRINEQYYFKTSKKSELVPLKKKNLLKEMGEHKSEISNYLKTEKISLKNDDDLKRLSNYINNL